MENERPETLDIRSVRMDLRTLKPRHIHGTPKNAHYMKAHTYNRLVENLKRDGALTQSPLVHKGEILSGHHRVKAALEAGIVEDTVLELQGEYTVERLTSIQLAHNAIFGEDDTATLVEMYESLPLDEKVYSGITDDMLKVEPLDLSSLSGGATQYAEIQLTFLPEDAEVFQQTMERLEKLPRVQHLLGSYADFGTFFDAVVKTKGAKNVYNTALALRAMADLALERIEQIEQEGSSDA